MALARRTRAALLCTALAGFLAAAAPAGGQTPYAPGPGPYDPAVPTVAELRGFPTGANFSLHADVERVLRGLEAATDRIRIERYGRSVEERDLWLVWISSPGNLAVVDSLRAANRAAMEGEPLAHRPAERLLRR